MIKVEDGHSAGYVQRQPVLTVKHQMHRSHMVEMLKAFKEGFGLSTVLEACVEAGIVIGTPQHGKYFCSVDGAGAPSVPHLTYKEAEAEAERLAIKAAGKVVRILQQQGHRAYLAKQEAVTVHYMEGRP